MNDSAGQFWEEILSREPQRIRAAFLSIDHESRQMVKNHLLAMAGEEGWQPVQRESALAALDVIKGEE